MARQGSGTGQGGKSFQDRELAARVRTLGLQEIEKALKRKDSDKFKQAVVLKLASSILPRLNEHTGADGKELPVPIFQVNAISANERDQKDSEP